MTKTMTKTMTTELEEMILDDDELESVVGGVKVPQATYVCVTCNKTLYGLQEKLMHTKLTKHSIFKSEHKSC